jgi:small subunit ribosomal protein S15
MVAKKSEKKEETEEKKDIVAEEKTDEAKEKSSKASVPSWVKMKPAELEKIVVELGKKGEPPAKIGLILRDTHGVPKSKLFSKKITQILDENKVSYIKDKDVIVAKTEKLKEHIKKNKHDHCASRALTKELWAINRFEKQL